MLIVKFFPFIIAGVILVLFARSKTGKKVAESYSDYIAHSVAKGVAVAVDNGEEEGESEMTGTDSRPSILSANSETLEREAEKQVP